MAANVWVEDAGKGRYRVCWRGDWRTKEDGTRERPRGSRTVGSAAARDELSVLVRKELDLHGVFEWQPEPEPEPPKEPKVGNLELGARAWIVHLSTRGAAKGTVSALTSGWARLSRDIRAVLGIGDDEPIPVSVLSRDLFTKLLDRWAKEMREVRVTERELGRIDVKKLVPVLGKQRKYDLSLYLYSCWDWLKDDPGQWPGVPPILSKKTCLPKAPPRIEAPDAPTVAELDAICRRAAASGDADLRDIVAFMRWTGLRAGQVLAVRVRDVDTEAATLRVMEGKSDKEKEEKRLIPIHRDLVALLAPRLKGRASALLFPRPKSEGVRKPPSSEVRALWVQATAAREVREDVWAPVQKKKARPDHAFRAGFLAALGERGVGEGVRHFLVGHSATTTEGRHYARPGMDALRAAVDGLPPIDWLGPERANGGNVVPLASARD